MLNDEWSLFVLCIVYTEILAAGIAFVITTDAYIAD